MDKRQFLARAAGALAGAAVTAIAPSRPARATARDWGNLPHYPDPDIEALDKRFTYGLGTAAIERIATGCRWCEGPVYFGDLRCLVWSDIPNNRLMRWNEEDGAVSVFRQPSNYANGNTRDTQGRLVTCEQDTRRVTRTGHDGSTSVLADHYQGKPLNSPNDVVVASDGGVWFTDPGFAILGNYESSARRPLELPTNVYRIDPRTGVASVVAGDILRPNGLAFSPDERLMYIVESGDFRDVMPRIRVYDVVDLARLGKGRVFAETWPGGADGLRTDTAGNLWCSFGWGDRKEDGVRCYAPGGDLIGKIHLPETAANLTFGGPKKNRLFICASTSVYSVFLDDTGAQAP